MYTRFLESLATLFVCILFFFLRAITALAIHNKYIPPCNIIYFNWQMLACQPQRRRQLHPQEVQKKRPETYELDFKISNTKYNL